MRGYRDRDIIETLDGLIFTVIGNMHPPDRVISYLKYIPCRDIESIWRRGDTRYYRILRYYSAKHVLDTIDSFLKEKHSDYIVYDKVYGIEMIEVPRRDIKTHYLPEERLREIIDDPRDELEELVRELVLTLSDETNVDLEFFGVTGSILLGIHNPRFSDIDLVVYGIRDSYRVREVLKKMFDNRVKGFSRLAEPLLSKYVENLVKAYPLDKREAYILYTRDLWNKGLFKNRFFSIHPVLLDHELSEHYGDRVYRGVGLARVKCRVVDTLYSLFTPSIYRVDSVEVVDGVEVDPGLVREVVSYESIYAGILSSGEEAIVYGKVEEVFDRVSGEKYYRVLVGSFEARGRDYIKPMRWLRG